MVFFATKYAYNHGFLPPNMRIITML